MVGPEVLGAVRGGKKMLGPAAAGVGITAVSALKPVISVQENQVGIRTRHKSAMKRGWLAKKLGREGDLYGVLRPDNGVAGTGTHVKLSHGVKMLSTAHKSNELKLIEVNTKEGEQFKIDASIAWCISHERDEYPYRALTAIENGEELGEAVASLCVSGLRKVTDGQPKAYFSDDEQVFDDLLECRQGELYASYGVRLVRLNLDTATETGAFLISDAIRHSNAANASAAVAASILLRQESAPTQLPGSPPVRGVA